MITVKQRRFYAIFITICFVSGAIIYGIPTDFSEMSFLGGLLIGGLASGCILFGRFMKRHYSVTLIVLSCILFPITFMIIVFTGVFTVIPYYICNLIIFYRIKTCFDSERLNKIFSGADKLTRIAVLGFIAFLVFGLPYVDSVREIFISKEIFEETGFPAGSADNVIVRKYYYDKSKDYTTKFNYDHAIKNGVLFVLAEKDNIVSSDIILPDRKGKYKYSDERASYFASGEYMRRDLDKLFTSIDIVHKGNTYAYMLTLDARTDEELISEYCDSFYYAVPNEKERQNYISPETIEFILENKDRTFADPETLRLHAYDDDGEGKMICIKSSSGKYVVYCDAVYADNLNYKLTVSYDGKNYTLLTYHDLVTSNISSDKWKMPGW